MVQMFMRDLKKVSALERFCYKGFLRNSSGTKFFVRLREVSGLGRFHYIRDSGSFDSLFFKKTYN